MPETRNPSLSFAGETLEQVVSSKSEIRRHKPRSHDGKTERLRTQSTSPSLSTRPLNRPDKKKAPATPPPPKLSAGDSGFEYDHQRKFHEAELRRKEKELQKIKLMRAQLEKKREEHEEQQRKAVSQKDLPTRIERKEASSRESGSSRDKEKEKEKEKEKDKDKDSESSSSRDRDRDKDRDRDRDKGRRDTKKRSNKDDRKGTHTKDRYAEGEQRKDEGEGMTSRQIEEELKKLSKVLQLEVEARRRADVLVKQLQDEVGELKIEVGKLRDARCNK